MGKLTVINGPTAVQRIGYRIEALECTSAELFGLEMASAKRRFLVSA